MLKSLLPAAGLLFATVNALAPLAQIGGTIKLLKPFPDIDAKEGEVLSIPAEEHIANTSGWTTSWNVRMVSAKFGSATVTPYEDTSSAWFLRLNQPEYAYGEYLVYIRATHNGPAPRDTVRDTLRVFFAQDFDDLIIARDTSLDAVEETAADFPLDTLFTDWDELRPFSYRLLEAEAPLGAALDGTSLRIGPAKDRHGRFRSAVEVGNSRGFLDTFNLHFEVANVNDPPVVIKSLRDTGINFFDTLVYDHREMFADADSGTFLGIEDHGLTLIPDRGANGGTGHFQRTILTPVFGVDEVAVKVSVQDGADKEAAFTFKLRTDLPMPLGKRLDLPLDIRGDYTRARFHRMPGPEPLLLLCRNQRIHFMDGQGRVARAPMTGVYETYGGGVFPVPDGFLIQKSPGTFATGQDTIIALRRRPGAWVEEKFPTGAPGLISQIFEVKGRPVIFRFQRGSINGTAYSYLDTTLRTTASSEMFKLPMPEGSEIKWFLPREGGFNVVWLSRPTNTKPDSLFVSRMDSSYRLVGEPRLVAAGSNCFETCYPKGIYFEKALDIGGHIVLLWMQDGNLYRTSLNADLSPRQERQRLTTYHSQTGDVARLQGFHESSPGVWEIGWTGSIIDCQLYAGNLVIDHATGSVLRAEKIQAVKRCGSSPADGDLDFPTPFGNGLSLVYREEKSGQKSMRMERTGDWAPVALADGKDGDRAMPIIHPHAEAPAYDLRGRKISPRGRARPGVRVQPPK